MAYGGWCWLLSRVLELDVGEYTQVVFTRGEVVFGVLRPWCPGSIRRK